MVDTLLITDCLIYQGMLKIYALLEIVKDISILNLHQTL